MKLPIGIRTLLAVVAAALAFTPLEVDTADAQEVKDITVVLPNPSALNVWPLHVAIGEGYMQEEGLNVTVQAVDGSSQCTAPVSFASP